MNVTAAFVAVARTGSRDLSRYGVAGTDRAGGDLRSARQSVCVNRTGFRISGLSIGTVRAADLVAFELDAFSACALTVIVAI